MILERFAYLSDCVMGRLLFGGDQVYTIERPWLQNKPFESCVPEGDYELGPWSSEKYPNVWQVRDVPGRTAILLHSANYVHQIQGCVAPGLSFTIRTPSDDAESCAVWQSRKACLKVFEFIAAQDEPRLSVISTAARLEDCA